jgi:cell division protein FtsQ
LRPSATTVRPPLDPRIRQRRFEVRRDQARRRRIVAVALAAMVSAVAATWLVLHSPLFGVRRLVVVGATHSGSARVQGAAGVGRGRPMVDVDSAAARRRVEALPWVLRARVHRAWPSTVRITVVERSAIAASRADGGWALLDAGGRVLERVGQPPPGLVPVDGIPPVGPPGANVGPAGAAVLRLVAVAAPTLGGRGEAVVVDHGQLEIRLRPRGTVLVGGPDALDDKVRAAVTVLGSVDGATVGVLDVRVPASPVLTRQ